MVTIVYEDGTTQQTTTVKAIRKCHNPDIAGHIIDVLTTDTDLQAQLRKMMDSAADGAERNERK